MGSSRSINISSYNQSGGITAHTVNVGRVPRSIDDTLRSQILRDLPRDKPITVIGLLGDAESCILAEQIHAFLKVNGFLLKEPNGISQGIFVPTPRGLSVNVKEDGFDFVVGTQA